MRKIAKSLSLPTAMVLSAGWMSACSQSSFGGQSPGTPKGAAPALQPDSANAAGTPAGPVKTFAATSPVSPAPASVTTVTQVTTTPLSIPTASTSDLPILQQCLAAWQSNPFHGVVSNYKKVVGETSYGSFGNVINDQTATASPELILVVAADNVGGVPTYQLLNPNGYYCFESSSDIGVVLTINIACTAHIAGPSFKQNVGSVGSPGAAAVTGSNTGAIVNLNYVNPSGGSCPGP